MAYTIGVMKMAVERPDTAFDQRVARATDQLRQALAGELDLTINLSEFKGPHLTPQGGTYAPLDFLQIGVSEKLERSIDFLLIVTDVDLTSATLAYTLALPSQLTNVGIISVKRLDPAFWGEPADEARTEQRLLSLLLHTFGHLLNLPHDPDPHNAMFDFQIMEDLDKMSHISAQQRTAMRRQLPSEAHDQIEQGARWRFRLAQLRRNWRTIAVNVLRANPLNLVTRLPTMLTATLSITIALFFNADIWDLSSTVGTAQLVIFSLIAISGATLVLYRAFAIGVVLDRQRRLSESAVVTQAVTVLSLLCTILLVYIGLFALSQLSITLIFPRSLMRTWTTVDPATGLVEHLKLSSFLAAFGVLAGSLGGQADSKQVVRSVLFVDEET